MTKLTCFISAIPPSPATFIPSLVPVTTPDPCPDQNSDCRSYEIPKVCNDYAAWARDNCQKSCNFCNGKCVKILFSVSQINNIGRPSVLLLYHLSFEYSVVRFPA